MRRYRKVVRSIIENEIKNGSGGVSVGATDGMSEREFDALMAAKILKTIVSHIPGHCEHCGGRLSHENICIGCGLANEPRLVSAPRGLEQLDREEILRLKYLGMLSSDPVEHFLGSDMERTFGEENGSVPEEDTTSVNWRARWERVNGRDKTVRCPVPVEGHHRTQEHWRTAFYKIGYMTSRLGLPGHVQNEIARIYVNLRKSGHEKMGGRHRTVERSLAKAAYLACLVHRLPRKREDLERGIRELYGFGIGEIPKEFVKAANFGHTRFGVLRRKGNRTYLSQWNVVNGKRIDYRSLGKL